jgi:SAM-dependent MidA family methyltransferase
MTSDGGPTGPDPGNRGSRPPAEPSPAPSPEGVRPAATGDESERSAALETRIREEIGRAPGKRITFARFMELALYEPELGYYRRPEDRPTDAGDFLTAPETHPIFGWTVARRIEELWERMGRPEPFALIEYGAGSGTLGRSILEGMRRHGSAAFGAVGYEPVETNPHRLASLRERFEEAGLAGKLAGGGPLPAQTPATGRGPVPIPAPNQTIGIVMANEFLDALPVHRVLTRGGRLRELCVAWRDRFVQVVSEPTTPALAERLADEGVVLAEEQVAEICLGLAPWLAEVAARLECGSVVVIDYGAQAAELYGPRHMAGTLLGYRAHRVADDPFADVGLTDLTAHVGFSAVARAAGECGFSVAGLRTQSEFLVEAGLETELRALQADPATAIDDYLRARSGIVRLLDPRRMGRFRVLTLERGGR